MFVRDFFSSSWQLTTMAVFLLPRRPQQAGAAAWWLAGWLFDVNALVICKLLFCSLRRVEERGGGWGGGGGKIEQHSYRSQRKGEWKKKSGGGRGGKKAAMQAVCHSSGSSSWTRAETTASCSEIDQKHFLRAWLPFFSLSNVKSLTKEIFDRPQSGIWKLSATVFLISMQWIV